MFMREDLPFSALSAATFNSFYPKHMTRSSDDAVELALRIIFPRSSWQRTLGTRQAQPSATMGVLFSLPYSGIATHT